MMDSAFVHSVVLVVLAVGIYVLAHVLGIADLNVLAGMVAGWAVPSPRAMLASRRAKRESEVPPAEAS